MLWKCHDTHDSGTVISRHPQFPLSFLRMLNETDAISILRITEIKCAHRYNVWSSTQCLPIDTMSGHRHNVCQLIQCLVIDTNVCQSLQRLKLQKARLVRPCLATKLATRLATHPCLATRLATKFATHQCLATRLATTLATHNSAVDTPLFLGKSQNNSECLLLAQSPSQSPKQTTKQP